MFWVTFGQVLPLGIGAGISPLPIVAIILNLLAPHGRAKGVAFAAGYLLVAAAITVIVVLLAHAAGVDESAEKATGIAVIPLLLGALFLFLAYRNWVKRPREGDTPKTPKWMAAIQLSSPGRSLRLGVILAVTNLKNLSISISTAAIISAATITAGQTVTLTAVYVLLASLGVGIPLVYLLVAGASAEKRMVGWKNVLVANNNVILAVLLVVLGALQIGDGLGGLFG